MTPAPLQKKVCMLGAHAVGKTSLVRRFVESLYSERYHTTVAVKVDKKTVRLDGRAVTLVLWDLFGDDAYQAVQPAHLRGMAGYLLVVDGTRGATVERARRLHERARESAGDPPFVLALNKRDLDDAWEVADDDLAWARARARAIVPTSAKTGAGVERAFRELARALLEGSGERERAAGVRAPEPVEDGDAAAGGDVLDGLLSGLDAALWVRDDGGPYRRVGPPPRWWGSASPGPAGDPVLDELVSELDPGEPPRAGAPVTSEPWRVRSADGSEDYLRATALRLGPGRRGLLVQRWTAPGRELQARLQTAREADLAHGRLLRELDAKEVLLHCIAHDLRGPLSGIQGIFSLLTEHALPPAEVAELHALGLRQTAAQEALIDDLLDVFAAELSALQDCDDDPTTAPDLARAVEAAAERLLPAYRERGVALALPERGPDAPPLRVCGDARRLERVLVNLLDNALRHAPAGSTVELRASADDGSARVEVADRGRGVPPELRAELFEKLVRGPGGGRSGLGLYFCRTTVERWGGEIGHEAREGGGSRFWFRLTRPAATPRGD